MGGHDGAAMGGEDLADGGEDRAAPQAIDHLGADLALQRRHMMAERRLDDTQPARRGRQAADVGDFRQHGEAMKMLRSHGLNLLGSILLNVWSNSASLSLDFIEF